MHDLFPLLAEYGALAVFLNVLLTQAGAPLPAVPTLLVGGALTMIGPLHFMELLPAAVSGALLGDALWYVAGRRYGRHVMALLCRVSLSPDSCVRRTRTQFERWGAPLLLISKFVPGLSTVSSALLGTMRTPFSVFAGYNLAGSALWAAIWLMLGRMAHDSIDQALRLLDMSYSIAPGMRCGCSCRELSLRTSMMTGAEPDSISACNSSGEMRTISSILRKRQRCSQRPAT